MKKMIFIAMLSSLVVHGAGDELERVVVTQDKPDKFKSRELRLRVAKQVQFVFGEPVASHVTLDEVDSCLLERVVVTQDKPDKFKSRELRLRVAKQVQFVFGGPVASHVTLDEVDSCLDGFKILCNQRLGVLFPNKEYPTKDGTIDYDSLARTIREDPVLNEIHRTHQDAWSKLNAPR